MLNTYTDFSILKDSDVIIEAAVEDICVKKEVFKKLDCICESHTIFATNTSSLSITELAAVTKRPDKVIGMHFFNPAPVMKLVEVVRGLLTLAETYEAIKHLSLLIEKQPIEVKETAGFSVNRILIPMINEAICMLDEGIASTGDIDKSMKLGTNHPMGHLELSDFIGNGVVLAIMETI